MAQEPRAWGGRDEGRVRGSTNHQGEMGCNDARSDGRVSKGMPRAVHSLALSLTFSILSEALGRLCWTLQCGKYTVTVVLFRR
jgi:hypothetical protein